MLVGGASKPALRSVARRRPRVPRPVVGLLVVAVLGLAWLGHAATRQSDPALAVADLPAAPPTTASALSPGGRRIAGTERVSRAAARTVPFATVEGLELALPHTNPLMVAFHEATRPEALPLAPHGELVANDNPTKFTATTQTPGPPYRVLSSRGRARPATSAVDVVVPEGASVTAPVTGRVVEVREYVLYGRLRDWRVVLEPAERPDLQVVLIHLHEPRVRVGDEVVAGTTPLAVVRQLPFDSHVDYATEQRLPHAHVEVKPAVAAGPADPNAPALPAEEDVPA
jgi:biotin carboxyl carrier protein